MKIISESCIKPSSPTPNHLKTYKISLLDQFLVPDPYIPLLFYYSNQQHHHAYNYEDFISKRSQLLKQSLSETLTHYYPLAGKIKDSLSIDCNDEGVYYAEARADISLSEYFSQSYLTLMDNLLPKQASSNEPSSPGSYAVMIQETTFSCGSFTVGLLVQHMLMDATALSSFVKAWSSIARNSRSKTSICVNFDGPFIFPQNIEFPREATMKGFEEQSLTVGTKRGRSRFVFDVSAIADLKVGAMSSGVERPTRVELVSAFLFECISDILNGRSGIDRPILFWHFVDMRRKVMPPLPQSCFGNFIWMAPGLSFPKETKLPSLVLKVRGGIRKIDAGFVENVRSRDGFSKLYEIMTDTRKLTSSIPSGVNSVMVTSLCNMGLYEIDFGWGKPMWVTCVDCVDQDVPPNSTIRFMNLMVLMDSGKGKGIEAWVLMDEEDLAALEKYEKLLAYASVNPSPALKSGFLPSHL